MKELVLSKRMEAVAALVPQNMNVVADVGCDHAYVSIKLKTDNKADKVIAMDLREGPLEIAAKNIERFGVEKDIEIRLSDGLDKLSKAEADAIVIAGMGGLLMRDILLRGIDILECEKPPILVLQPQSDIREVRYFLYSHSYNIVREKMVFEEGKYYTAILAIPGERPVPEREEDLVYGGFNIDSKDEILQQFLKKEEDVYTSILNSLNDNEKAAERRKELTEKLELNRRAQIRCGL